MAPPTGTLSSLDLTPRAQHLHKQLPTPLCGASYRVQMSLSMLSALSNANTPQPPCGRQKKKRGEESSPRRVDTLERDQAARLRRSKPSPTSPAARSDIEAGSGVGVVPPPAGPVMSIPNGMFGSGKAKASWLGMTTPEANV